MIVAIIIDKPEQIICHVVTISLIYDQVKLMFPDLATASFRNI